MGSKQCTGCTVQYLEKVRKKHPLSLQEPRKWLKKTLQLANVSLSLESSLQQARANDIPMPLLHIDESEVS